MHSPPTDHLLNIFEHYYKFFISFVNIPIIFDFASLMILFKIAFYFRKYSSFKEWDSWMIRTRKSRNVNFLVSVWLSGILVLFMNIGAIAYMKVVLYQISLSNSSSVDVDTQYCKKVKKWKQSLLWTKCFFLSLKQAQMSLKTMTNLSEVVATPLFHLPSGHRPKNYEDREVQLKCKLPDHINKLSSCSKKPNSNKQLQTEWRRTGVCYCV